MDIEYEATFTNVDKGDIRRRLEKASAELVRPEVLQKKTVFDLPKGHEIDRAWLRVRDEGEKTTMSLKVITDEGRGRIDNQKEICIEVSSMEDAEEILESIGCRKRAYEENKRDIISRRYIYENMPRLVFDMENPFL